MCVSCETSIEGGVPRHERHCPDAWKSVARECLGCGAFFFPAHYSQQCCGQECVAVALGWAVPECELTAA